MSVTDYPKHSRDVAFERVCELRDQVLVQMDQLGREIESQKDQGIGRGLFSTSVIGGPMNVSVERVADLQAEIVKYNALANAVAVVESEMN